MTNARNLPGLNSGESYNQELSRIEKFSDLIQNVQNLKSDSAKRFKTKEFYGQIYTRKSFTRSEIESIVDSTFMQELGNSQNYVGFKVYIPERLAIYPNFSDSEIKLYNQVISGAKTDPKTKKNLKKKEWFEAQPEQKQKEFSLIERRLSRFPWFFAKQESATSSYPTLCKVKVFDDGVPLHYGLFLEALPA